VPSTRIGFSSPDVPDAGLSELLVIEEEVPSTRTGFSSPDVPDAGQSAARTSYSETCLLCFTK